MSSLMSSTERAVELLEAFTPIDQSVSQSLQPDLVAAHAADLYTRLAIAAEVGTPGVGAALVGAALRMGDAAAGIRELDAALEFGKRWHELSAAEHAQAERAEIRQEIQHFDRIMDVDSITENRWLKHRRDFVSSEGALGAVERLLVLVAERQASRSQLETAREWMDVSALRQGSVGRSGKGAVIHRSEHPRVVAACLCPDTASAEKLLGDFETFAIRHPLGVCLGLLDYVVTARGGGLSTFASAVAEEQDGGEARATIWAAGKASWLVVTRDGFDQHVFARGSLEGRPLGSAARAYARETVHLPAGSWLVLVLDEGQSGRLSVDDLSRELSARNKSGKAYLHENLERIAPSSPRVSLKRTISGTSATRSASDDGDALREVARACLRGANRVRLSLECGHVHADREMGAAQLHGLKLGGRFGQALRAEAETSSIPLALEVTPMVDDDHVLNRLSYRNYRTLFSDAGLTVDEILLESSPVTRAVAHDLLRRAVARNGDQFELDRIGDNLYFTSGETRIELIEDLEGEMRNGCVLFDTALVVYRMARRELSRVFWRVTGHSPFDVHNAMTDEYDRASDPRAREDVRRRFDSLYIDPWEQVRAGTDTTPFLNELARVVGNDELSDERVLIVNVLEDYYRPLESKVMTLARALGLELPLLPVYFSPYGHGLSIEYPQVLATS